MSRASANVVLVTGASAGFGSAIARRFAEDGARVVLAARRLDRIEALAAEIGERAHAIELDVRNRAAVEFEIANLPADFAGIDVLVNNAGLRWASNPRTKPRSTTGKPWSTPT